MNADQIKDITIAALEDLKGKNIETLDVRELTDIADYMIICTGTSNRHVKSLADNAALELKRKGVLALGIEGADQSITEWALVDFGDVILHVMLPDTRDTYDLESLWSVARSDEQ
jgi:ribosome-associated protein